MFNPHARTADNLLLTGPNSLLSSFRRLRSCCRERAGDDRVACTNAILHERARLRHLGSD